MSLVSLSFSTVMFCSLYLYNYLFCFFSSLYIFFICHMLLIVFASSLRLYSLMQFLISFLPAHLLFFLFFYLLTLLLFFLQMPSTFPTAPLPYSLPLSFPYPPSTFFPTPFVFSSSSFHSSALSFSIFLVCFRFSPSSFFPALPSFHPYYSLPLHLIFSSLHTFSLILILLGILLPVCPLFLLPTQCPPSLNFCRNHL